MKTNHRTSILAYSCAFLIGALLPSAVQAQHSGASTLSYIDEPKPEKPKTTTEKLQILKTDHEAAFSKISGILNKIPTQPDLLGAKELFDSIDEADREMKRIRKGCTYLMSSLRSEAKAIRDGSAFTDDQKQELLSAADAIAKDCTELSAKVDLAIKQLAASYTVVPRWRSIHRSYRNLQGDAKASEQVKVQIDAYLNSYTESAESKTEAQENAAEAPAVSTQ